MYYGNHEGFVLLLFALFAGTFIVIGVSEKRGWKRRRTVFGVFLLTFGAVMVYSFILDVPVAYAMDNDLKIYYFHEDHIGRPLRMSEYSDYDSDGSILERVDLDLTPDTNTIWDAQYEVFGALFSTNDSIGIEVGDSGTTGVVWEPRFRFPGQYSDYEEIGSDSLFYNRWRWYEPRSGRYTSADPLGNIEDNLYGYAGNNPSVNVDLLGLKCGKFEDADNWYNVEPGDLLVYYSSAHAGMVYDVDPPGYILAAEHFSSATPVWGKRPFQGMPDEVYRHPVFKGSNVKYVMENSGIDSYCGNQWNRWSSCQDCAGYVSRVWSKLGVSVSGYAFYDDYASMPGIAIGGGGYKLEKYDSKECCETEN